jgi:uncharacterized pyridoxamine 5'-phosphate oxidase family protein
MLIIRVSKEKNLILSMNKEKVYFLWQNNKEIFNSLQYNEVSDYFDLIEKETFFQ